MLDYQSIDPATAKQQKKRVHPMIRALVGILGLLFLTPTVYTIEGVKTDDGAVSTPFGIIMTLSIAGYFGFVAVTGRSKVWRRRR